MTAFHLYSIPAKMIMVAMLGLLLPQSPDNPPMTKDAVKRLFNNLKKDSNLKDAAKDEVVRVGVDFELDPPTEREFRDAGMDQSLLDAIRRHARITTLTVQCEPVECEVTINGEVVGTTVGTILTKSAVKPGVVAIKVSASGFETKTGEVRLSPGEHLKAPKFTMDPLTGGLAITCKPAPVCGI